MFLDINEVQQRCLKTGFDIQETLDETLALRDLMAQIEQLATNAITKRKARQNYQPSTFNETMLQMHQYLRHYISSNRTVYSSLVCTLEFDKVKLNEELRKIQYLKVCDSEDLEVAKRNYERVKKEVEKLKAKMTASVKQKYLYLLEESFVHDGEQKMTDEEQDVWEFTAGVARTNINNAMMEEEEKKSIVDNFWLQKPESYHQSLRDITQNQARIINVPKYLKLLSKMKLHRRWSPDDEKGRDEDQKEVKAAEFDSSDLIKCGVDLEYTGMGKKVAADSN